MSTLIIQREVKRQIESKYGHCGEKIKQILLCGFKMKFFLVRFILMAPEMSIKTRDILAVWKKRETVRNG